MEICIIPAVCLVALICLFFEARSWNDVHSQVHREFVVGWFVLAD